LDKIINNLFKMKGLILSLSIALCFSIAYAQTKAKAKPTPKPTPKPTVAPAALKCRVYNVTVKLTNVTFNDYLSNIYTNDYNGLRVEVEAGIHQAFDGYNPFQALKVNSFSKAADGKTLAQIFLEMKNNGSAHLGNLIKQLAKGKLGMFQAQKTLVYAGCYFVPPPVMMCSYGCPTICAPSCSSTCCNQYVAPAPAVMIPAAPPALPPPPPSACPAPCSPACAPSCHPGCCMTAYSAGPYGKRTHAPKPEGAKTLKHHILKKHHKKTKN
jgi:hypothetical protein